ncbi:glutathione-regulated potassium-efflux system oxidoreductase KefF [Bordetella genomosp. 9]|uniref:Glutathione-regulated potassium-efflux system ancillary protein KefF n=1 Tax=Bordetella genomosp. 9 TaxID=1416803 RepID=A0A1W6Z0Y1_9BORD|nr:glutathione-regulated potassium-efflux system oxidoreductase KefF [Bordetella genomosp. 9]ARP86503.1 glutathione-regulated potassium-efflux system ancillary protein KefF [Bordetella genomosp. 9]
MILIVYAHPYPAHSRANRALLDALAGMPDLQVRSLYDLYPDFHIDAAAEQAALAQAGMIVWQHPMHWYGAPPLFKLWMDKVLQHGWAYGAGGTALRDKAVMWSVTTGGAADDFMRCADTDLAVLAQPLRSAAELCGMRWLAPFAVHGAATLDAAALQSAAARYRERLASHDAGARPAMMEAAHG